MGRGQGAQCQGGWPQYYIGVTPYCFVLPHKPEAEPVDKGDLRMGQAPGTQWYHAHKHGSTAINVMNGMTGAFIIEGKYDDDLNAFYSGYGVKRGGESKPWSTRSISRCWCSTSLGRRQICCRGGMGPAGPAGVPFAVNGRVGPKAHMQPGEVQLWRIVNSSSRNALYFMAPEAPCNGVKRPRMAFNSPSQTTRALGNQNRPFYMAPANRVDLLVQAPMTPGNFKVMVQPVMARSQVQPTPVHPNTNDQAPGTALMTVDVSGEPVTQYGEPIAAPMPFPRKARRQSSPNSSLTSPTRNWRAANYSLEKFIFDSKAPKRQGSTPSTASSSRTVRRGKRHLMLGAVGGMDNQEHNTKGQAPGQSIIRSTST